MLINVPLENLNARYSEQWNRWICPMFERAGIPGHEIVDIYPDYPDANPAEEIKSGQFLDIIGTNIFKSAQLNHIMHDIAQGEIGNDNDIFFFHDLWYPGIEQLFYIRDLMKRKFKICGILHAGTYDRWDLLAQNNLQRWAAAMETAWLNEVDAVFVSVPFHKELVCRERSVHPDRVIVTGLPWLLEGETDIEKKENIVIFPHRLAPEKQPDKFIALEAEMTDRMPGWQFIRSQDKKRTKDEYYKLLRSAKISVSYALQETWGIAMLESVLYRCLPVVPDRLAYKYLFHSHYRYADNVNSTKAVADMVLDLATRYDTWAHSAEFTTMRNKFIDMGELAIPNMVAHMDEKGWLK